MAWVCIIVSLHHDMNKIVHQFFFVFFSSNGYVVFLNTAHSTDQILTVSLACSLSLYLLSVMPGHCYGQPL